MRKKTEMHGYQNHTVRHIMNNNECGLFLGMGLGKTIASLTAAKMLLEDFAVNKILVIGPKYVAHTTWSDEILEWEHTCDMSYSIMKGTPNQRIAALKRDVDIYLISRDLVAWLVTVLQGAWPFDMVIIDEISSFKNNDSLRFKSLKLIRPFIKRLVGLTGTPAGNGLVDLWAPMFLIDRGKRLGESISAFRHQYFTPGAISGRAVLNYKIRPNSKKQIFDKIGDICISMEAKDYLKDLPVRIEKTITIEFDEDTEEQYNKFEEEQVLMLLETETEINALNAAALTGKLLQFANGFVYDSEKKGHIVHDHKLEALGEIIEAAQDDPVLVFYQFKHDRERIMKKFNAVHFQGEKDKKAWNEGKIRVMCCHAASAGHGLNIQKGGHIVVWYGLTWSLELYQQANARLDRQGQVYPVLIYKLLMKGTLDLRVLKALNDKETDQDELIDALRVDIVKELIKKHAA